MRGRRIAVALAALCATVVRGPAAGDAQSGVATVGVAAKPFVLERLDGAGQYSLRSYRGRPLAINVFAAWCENCRLEAPLLAAAYAAYRGRIAFLGVDEQESASRGRAFVRDLRIAFPVALDDGQFAATYGTTQIPETIFVDGRGIVREIRRGLPSRAELNEALARIANATPGT